MEKLTKPIFGVPDGEIYPREIPAGDDCPENLRDYAESLGALAEPEAELKPEPEAEPEVEPEVEAGPVKGKPAE